jgi:hypothetical protein
MAGRVRHPDPNKPSCHDPQIKNFANAFWRNDGVTTPRSLGRHTNPWKSFFPSFLGVLLDEKRFPKLISAYERLHCAESDEQVLNLAILVNFLRRAQ